MLGEVPSGWQQRPLGDLFVRVNRKNRAGVTRVLTASGEHGLIDQAVFFNKTVAGADLSTYLHVKRGEFAYNRSAMNGYPVGAVKRLDRYDEGVVSSLYLCFAARDDAPVCADFAAHVFDSAALETELRPIVKVGARAHGLLNVAADDFMGIRFPLPPLPEQKKIAAILSSVDEAIQATQAVIDRTRRVKEGLLQDLLTRGIGHTRFKQTEIGEIPEGWEVRCLSSLLTQDIRNGYSPVCAERPNGRWVLGLGALTPDGLDVREVKPAPVDDSKIDEFMLHPGDFLVSRSNTPARVGLSALFRGEIGACTYPDLMMRFRVDGRAVHLPFLEVFLRSPIALGYLRGAAAGTSASMVKITKATLEKLPILLPSIAEQRLIAERVQSADAVYASSCDSQRRFRSLKSGLLTDLLTGKVRVTP